MHRVHRVDWSKQKERILKAINAASREWLIQKNSPRSSDVVATKQQAAFLTKRLGWQHGAQRRCERAQNNQRQRAKRQRVGRNANSPREYKKRKTKQHGHNGSLGTIGQHNGGAQQRGDECNHSITTDQARANGDQGNSHRSEESGEDIGHAKPTRHFTL